MSCSSCSRMWQCHTYSFPPVRGLAGTVKGKRRGQIELGDHRDHLAGVHPHRLIPAPLVGIGSPGRSEVVEGRVGRGVKGLPGNNLPVDQVDVHGVGVAGEVGDAPDLRRPIAMVSVTRRTQ